MLGMVCIDEELTTIWILARVFCLSGQFCACENVLVGVYEHKKNKHNKHISYFFILDFLDGCISQVFPYVFEQSTLSKRVLCHLRI